MINLKTSLTQRTSILKIIPTSSASQDLDKDLETVLVGFCSWVSIYKILLYLKARDMLTRLWRLPSYTPSGTSSWSNARRQQRKMIWTSHSMRMASLEESSSKLNVFWRNNGPLSFQWPAHHSVIFINIIRVKQLHRIYVHIYLSTSRYDTT